MVNKLVATGAGAAEATGAGEEAAAIATGAAAYVAGTELTVTCSSFCLIV
jgi:hypothetical protein